MTPVLLQLSKNSHWSVLSLWEAQSYKHLTDSSQQLRSGCNVESLIYTYCTMFIHLICINCVWTAIVCLQYTKTTPLHIIWWADFLRDALGLPASYNSVWAAILCGIGSVTLFLSGANRKTASLSLLESKWELVLWWMEYEQIWCTHL